MKQNFTFFTQKILIIDKVNYVYTGEYNLNFGTKKHDPDNISKTYV